MRATPRVPRPAAAALALTAAYAAVVGTSAAPAYADTVIVPVHCELPLQQPSVDGPQSITLDTPTQAAHPGDKIKIKVTLGPSPATSPLPFPGTPTTPSIELTMSGGSTGTVVLQGDTMRVDIPGAPNQILVPPYEGDFTVPADATGDISIAPGKMVTHTSILGDQITTCFPQGPVAPAAVVHVALGAAPSDASSAPELAPDSASAPAAAAAPTTSQAGEAQSARNENASSSSSSSPTVSNGLIFGIVGGVIVLVLAGVMIQMFWRRHLEEDDDLG